MHAYKLIIVLFLLAPLTSLSFEKDLGLRWYSGFDIKLNKNFSSNELITKPVNTYQVIAEISYLDRKFSIHKDCLIYFIPGRSRVGELKIVSPSNKEKCREVLLRDTNMKWGDIYNFTYSVEGRFLVLKIDTKILKFELANMELSSKKILYSGKYPGVQVSFTKSKSIGRSPEEGDICFDVDDKCEVIKKDICSLCPSAILPAISSNCRKQVRKYCSNLECGLKNSPACIRGFAATDYKLEYCIADSPVAFCQSPYRVLCIDGELRCR